MENNVVNFTQEDLPVKERCIDQRNAQPDEPKCVVCSRYGEYVCDQTDDDICSLECKAALLASKSSTIPATIYEDECPIFGVDGRYTLPEWEPDESISAEEVTTMRKTMDVNVRGDCPPAPVVDFSKCRLPPRLLENLVSQGYETPTAIQMQAIPAAFKGRDVLVSSATGSGKTLAYLLPVVFKCCRIRMGRFSNGKSPLAVVLAPTRELCEQVEEQAKALGKGLPFKTALVVGGDAMPRQVYRIGSGVELIVGTPGRLLDLLSKHGEIDLGDVCMLVLDEVDCMLERGFRDQAIQVLQALSGPQMMLFSATIPPAIRSFSASITKRLLVISASQRKSSVREKVIWVETKSKKKKLFEILQSHDHFQPPAIVFVASRIGADLLSEAVVLTTGLRCAPLHGQKAMDERRRTMRAFLLGELDVVVATGILGRGMDLLNVRQVILFDMPSTLKEYTHQIGRASRMDVPGLAFVFINNESKACFTDFVQLLRGNGVSVPHQLLNSPHTQHAKKRKLKH